MASIVALMLSGKPFPPAVQTGSKYAQWAIALGAALIARDGDPALPCYVALWTVGWTVACRLLMRSGPWATAIKVNFPVWSWAAGFAHGGIILPTLLLGSWYGAGDLERAGSATFASDPRAFLYASWAGSPRLLEHCHAAVIGYLLKDYELYKDEGLEAAYLVHHFLSVTGCSLCLLMPTSAGLTALNAVQVEFASSFYSFMCIFPNRLAKAWYFVHMPISNLGAAYITYLVFRAPIALWYRLIYLILAILIITVRCSGVVIEAQKTLAPTGPEKASAAASPPRRKRTAKAD